MKLSKAAQFFDRDSCYDAYTGEYLWKGQFSSYDGSKPDGSFERRRTVSVKPNTPNAQRRVVQVHKDKWILGEFVADSFYDKEIRLTAGAKLVTDRYQILTPGQAANREATNWTAFAQTRYLKDTVNSPTDSDYNPFYEVHFSSTEPIKDGYFLRSADRLLHVRSSFPHLEGFHVVEGDEISYEPTQNFGGNGEVEVTISGGRDPILETYTTDTAETGILLDMYMLYNYITESDPRNQQGDKTLIVANTVEVEVGDTLKLEGTNLLIEGESWQVKGKSPYYDAWNLHIRRTL